MQNTQARWTAATSEHILPAPKHDHDHTQVKTKTPHIDPNMIKHVASIGDKNAIMTREMYQHKPTPKKKPVMTPAGLFNSLDEAAAHYKVTGAAISYRVKHYPKDYQLKDPT